MTPIPELNARTFIQTGLEGRLFANTVDLLYRLMSKNKTILLPGDDVELGNLPITMNRSLVISGDSDTTNFIQFMDKKIVPYYFSDLRNETKLSKIFGMRITFDPDLLQINISRKRNTVILQHDLVEKPISQGNRNTMLGLALLPDSLWEHAVNRGIIVGDIEGVYDNRRWKISKIRAFSLHDSKGTLGQHRSNYYELEDYLEKLQNGKLYPQLDKAKIEYFKKIQPVGIFFDHRSRD